MAEKSAQPINEEVISEAMRQLRADFPSFLKQPVEEGLFPPRDWLIQQIEHTPCPPGEETNLVPFEIPVAIPKDAASDAFRARKISARAKAGILDRLEKVLLIGGLHPGGWTLNGLFTLPGDPPAGKLPGQGVWLFCENAIKSYRNTLYYDSSLEKLPKGEDSEPGLILMIHKKLKAKLMAQGGAPESCEIEAASGKIKLDGVRILGSDLLPDDNTGMVIPQSSFELLLHPDLRCRPDDNDPNSILVSCYANVWHRDGWLWDPGVKDGLIYFLPIGMSNSTGS